MKKPMYHEKLKQVCGEGYVYSEDILYRQYGALWNENENDTGPEKKITKQLREYSLNMYL